MTPGQVLAGKFRVERVLGKGGMGMVVAAHHLALDERVALKFMLAEVMNSPDAVDRFLREARAAVKLRGEHVCRVMDVGRLDDGAPYIVMEYLEGSDLAAELARRGGLGVAEATGYVHQACLGMAEAHQLGIVHRDLKPQNLFLTRRSDGTPLVKVLDFGISKAAFAQGGAHTQTQALMGSPAYMSPEQMRSAKHVDGRSDVYALGAILYQLLTRRLPFTADTLPQLCVMVLNDPPVPMRAARPDVPPALEAIVMSCLAKAPEQRPASAGALAAQLAPFMAASPVVPVSGAEATLPLAAAAPVVVGARSTLGGSAAEVQVTVAPRRRAPLLIGLGVAAAGAVALAVVAMGGGGKSDAGQPVALPPAPTMVERPIETLATTPPDAGAPEAAARATVVPDAAPPPAPLAKKPKSPPGKPGKAQSSGPASTPVVAPPVVPVVPADAPKCDPDDAVCLFGKK